MSLIKTLVKSTPNQLQYLLSYESDEGSNSLIISNADMAGDLVAGPLSELRGLGEDISGENNQAECRAALLGDGADEDLEHAQCTITLRSGDGAWSVDADVDETSGQRSDLTVAVADGSEAEAYLVVAFQHSIFA